MGKVTVIVVALLGLALAAPAAWAQEPVSGTVTDSATMGPIVGATVRLDAQGGESWTATTGDDGSYSLDVPAGTYSLHASAGSTHHPRTIESVTVPAGAPVDVALDPNAPPTATVTGPTARAVRGEAVTFRSAATDDRDDLASRRWTHGGGEPLDDGAGESTSVRFASPGLKTVSLVVTDGLGAESEPASAMVLVNHLPTGTLSHSAEPTAGDPVTWTVAGADGDGDDLDYAWDVDGDGFDDGTEARVRPTYPTSGRFTVAVRIGDGFESTVVTGSVGVTSAPGSSDPGPAILPVAGTADTTAPALTVERRGSRALRTARRRGLRFALACDEPCTVYLEVLVPRRAARKLRIARRPDGPVRVGRVTATSGPDGSKARLRLTKKARKRLRKARRVKLTLQGSAWDAGGYATLYAPRKLTLRAERSRRT